MKRVNREAERILQSMRSLGDGALEHDALSEYLASYMRALRPARLTETEYAAACDRFWKVVKRLQREKDGVRGAGAPRRPLSKVFRASKMFRAELKRALIVCLERDETLNQNNVAVAMAQARDKDEDGEARQLRKWLTQHCVDWDATRRRVRSEWFSEMQNSVRD